MGTTGAIIVALLLLVPAADVGALLLWAARKDGERDRAHQQRLGSRRRASPTADVARGLVTATIPVAYALGHLTWAHLYAASFLLGALTVFFYVAYGGFLQVVVPRERYVEANSLVHGSRAFSFLAGFSLGGVLVQLLRGPYALALDAGSFLWSAFFLGRIDDEEPPGAPHEPGALLSGVKWIRHNAIIRAELLGVATLNLFNFMRSEERRVGKECRSRWSPYH